jgi:glycosyltransferase involved in cell wall biosynthesis
MTTGAGSTNVRPLDVAMLFDSPDENWPSMDLVGEMLLAEWRSLPSLEIQVDRVSIPIPARVRRLPWAVDARSAFNADRALARYVAYPFRAWRTRRPGRLFHIVDHSYAQLIHVLPAQRTGVYCHDLDAFRPLLTPVAGAPAWSRALAWTLLRGLRSAAVIFHSTREVGRTIASLGLAPRSRLVYAPYGVGPEFNPLSDETDGTPQVIEGLNGRPYVLHVGSEIPRKRLDVVFETFARLRAQHPTLRLVQQGARLTAAQQAHVARLGLRDALVQPPKLDRRTLAGLYRRAALVLVPSEAEGFGFPVVEAMACGAAVVASDIPVLREVGGSAAVFAPVGDVGAWTAATLALLNGDLAAPPRSARIRHAATFTWEKHGRTILDAYREVANDVSRRGNTHA